MAKIRIRDKKLSDNIPKKMVSSRRKFKRMSIFLAISAICNAFSAYYIYNLTT